MRYILIALVLMSISCKENQNTSSTDTSEREETELDTTDSASSSVVKISSIEDIKQLYAEVNSRLQQMDTLGFNYNCNNERSGHVRYYSEDGNLKIITNSYGEYSHFSATNTYFIKDDKPYFIMYDETSWTFDGQANGQPQTKDNVTEKRFYVVDQQLVKCLEKTYVIRSAASDNPNPAQVANKEVTCPSMDELQNAFYTLYKHRTNTSNVECL